MPDTAARRQFIEKGPAGDGQASLDEASSAALAKISNGLSLESLHVMLARARRAGNPLSAAQLGPVKKSMIERQCQGLLEFVEPRLTLDLVVGHAAAKRRLRTDADLLLRGRLDAAPMGYLISGPVGTGKTFLAECYAGSIGIPCVKLRNFRSKYVGETEGNLEQVLTVLRSLGPVVVIIDEADAALGNRSAEGDSGTSSRVFSMLASQMGANRPDRAASRSLLLRASVIDGLSLAVTLAACDRPSAPAWLIDVGDYSKHLPSSNSLP